MTVRIITADVRAGLARLPDESIHCCVTSPPYYGLRDYGIEPQVWPDGWRGSLGLEPTPALWIEHMVAVFREVRRVLRRDGTLWLNIGDSYAAGSAAAGCKPKDLLGIPWMLAFALRDDGWYLRSEITWAKRAPMPESVTDRPTSATEKVFLLAKSPRYFYDAEAVKEAAVTIDKRRGDGGSWDTARKQTMSGGPAATHMGSNGMRNMHNWWLLGPSPYPDAHFATFVPEIPRRAILAGCPVGGTVLDPFLGAGTTALVADRLGRHCIGIEINAAYAAMAERRVRGDAPLFADITTEGDMPPDWREQDSLGSWRVALDAMRQRTKP